MIKLLFARLTDSGRQALVLTGINSVFWFAWAFGSYQTIYLQQAGFTASQLGVLNALTSIFSIASVAFWGMVSDRMGSLRKVLILVLLGGSLLFALIPLIPTGPSVYISVTITASLGRAIKRARQVTVSTGS